MNLVRKHKAFLVGHAIIASANGSLALVANLMPGDHALSAWCGVLGFAGSIFFVCYHLHRLQDLRRTKCE